MGGTLTFASPHLGVGLASTLQLRLGKDREARRRWGGSSTLLGPEGTGPRPLRVCGRTSRTAPAGEPTCGSS